MFLRQATRASTLWRGGFRLRRPPYLRGLTNAMAADRNPPFHKMRVRPTGLGFEPFAADEADEEDEAAEGQFDAHGCPDSREAHFRGKKGR